MQTNAMASPICVHFMHIMQMDKNRNDSATNLSNTTTANYIQNFIHSSSYTDHINGNYLDFDITDQLLIRYFTFVRDWRKNGNTTNFTDLKETHFIYDRIFYSH
jgi:hypothetical protein